MITEINLRTITVFIAVLGLFFGVIEFIQVQEIEARKPYLEKKLKWCEEAVETASSIANSDNISESEVQRFWEMYWGVMGLVEKETISTAMIAFGDALESKDDLENKSLAIAHACRAELSIDWSSSWAR